MRVGRAALAAAGEPGPDRLTGSANGAPSAIFSGFHIEGMSYGRGSQKATHERGLDPAGR
jgi:hypothetical protein